MKFFDKIKEKRQYKKDEKMVLEQLAHWAKIASIAHDMYDLDTYDDYFKEHYAKIYSEYEKDFGTVLKQPKEFQVYVEKAEELDEIALENGIPYYLWNSHFMYKKITEFIDNTSVLSDKSSEYAEYVAIMGKFVKDEEILEIFHRFYETGEIDFNKELYGKTIWQMSLDTNATPLMAILIEYAKHTHEIPYPAYLVVMHISYNKGGLQNCKISEDGLHLVKCSEYEFNEITGRSYRNIPVEERIKAFRDEFEIKK